ncbi:MAG: L,D-transpeptidase family protein [Abyssibacter sp.]|uniref:L,D-transpeptidase family protein n=1 Tax=Abyssibacter sp. TaxID=2320200 RepID=UPI00321BD0F7
MTTLLKRRLLRLCLPGLLVLSAGSLPAWAQVDPGAEALRARLELIQQRPDIPVASETLHAAEALRLVYDQRGYRPVWIANQQATAALRALPEWIAEAEAHGFQPQHYHLEALTKRLSALPAARAAPDRLAGLVDLELLATDATLTLARHFQDGIVDPTTIDPQWHLPRRMVSSAADLLQQLESQPVGVARETLFGLLPNQPEYRALVQRLALQTSLRDQPWAALSPGRTLRPGDSAPIIPEIAARLAALGDGAATTGSVFDSTLESAVQRFQTRHGLTADGVIGPETLRALNTTPAERIAQLRANLARWRWLPADLGEEHILVNIAGFRMEVRAGGDMVMEQRVIVGKPARQSPVFTGNMTYIVLNPSWEVPPSIAGKDLLPQFQRDPGTVDRMGMQVLSGWGADERAIDAATLDWSRYSATSLPFRLRQRPGPQNALGVAKFMFPNKHNVYLHDTPARGLFAKDERAFSSGCIRIADPVGLAEWVLGPRNGTPVAAPERIQSILGSGQETTVRLKRPLAVHLLYWTAWIAPDGQVHYRKDIYDRDAKLLRALDAPPR